MGVQSEAMFGDYVNDSLDQLLFWTQLHQTFTILEENLVAWAFLLDAASVN